MNYKVKRKCLAGVETVRSVALKKKSSQIYILPHLTAGWDYNGGSKKKMDEETKPLRDYSGASCETYFPLLLRINLKDGGEQRREQDKDAATILPQTNSFFILFISFWFVSFRSWVVSEWFPTPLRVLYDEQRAGIILFEGEEMRLETAWLCFFFKYNGLGSEARKSTVFLWGTPAA